MEQKYFQKINDFVKEVSKNKKINSIYLFGSYLNNFGNLSDIDICIIGTLNSKEKKEILRESSEIFDVCFFDELPIFIKVRVFKEGKEMFSGNKKKTEIIKYLTLKEYRDFIFFMKNRINGVFQNA